MARKRKARATPEPGPAAAPRIATGLGALLRDELAKPKSPKQPKRAAAGAGGGSGPAGRPSRIPPTQPPPGPAPTERVPTPPGPPSEPPPTEPPVHDARSLRILNDAYAGTTPLRATRQGKNAPPTPRVASPRLKVPPRSSSEDDEARARLAALVGGGVHFSVERDEDGRYEGLRQGVPRTVLRRLRGPGYHAEASLDLHGMRGDEAEAAVNRFVRDRRRGGARYLLIVHGAGNHSEAGQSVLAPRTVQALTAGGAAPLVRAFATAHSRRGGLGALAVMLQ